MCIRTRLLPLTDIARLPSMTEILVLYYSRFGSTAAMANLIVRGIGASID